VQKHQRRPLRREHVGIVGREAERAIQLAERAERLERMQQVQPAQLNEPAERTEHREMRGRIPVVRGDRGRREREPTLERVALRAALETLGGPAVRERVERRRLPRRHGPGRAGQDPDQERRHAERAAHGFHTGE
jgi:hypothetical protein